MEVVGGRWCHPWYTLERASGERLGPKSSEKLTAGERLSEAPTESAHVAPQGRIVDDRCPKGARMAP